MIFLVRLVSPHSLSFNRQFNALLFILGEKDEFIITKAKRGGEGRKVFHFLSMTCMHSYIWKSEADLSFVCRQLVSIAIVGDCRSLRIEFS